MYARATVRLMPLLTPPGAVILDVTLCRDGAVRRWTINSEATDGWSCRSVAEHSVTVSGCKSKEEMLAMHREWLAEIEVARADGWN
jgi:hypothetical protein